VRVKQAREKGNSYGEGGYFFTCSFWETRGDLSVGKSTNHDVLEGIHY